MCFLLQNSFIPAIEHVQRNINKIVYLFGLGCVKDHKVLYKEAAVRDINIILTVCNKFLVDIVAKLINTELHHSASFGIIHHCLTPTRFSVNLQSKLMV